MAVRTRAALQRGTFACSLALRDTVPITAPSADAPARSDTRRFYHRVPIKGTSMMVVGLGDNAHLVVANNGVRRPRTLLRFLTTVLMQGIQFTAVKKLEVS